MGRDLTDVHMDDKPNGVVKSNGAVNSNGNLRDSEGTESNGAEVKECTLIIQNGIENQDVLDVKSTDFGMDMPDEKDEKTGDWKFTENKKLIPTTSKSSGAEHICVHNASKPGANGRTSVNSTRSPTVVTRASEGGSLLTTPMSRKLFQPFDRRHPDEEDNWSVASTYPLFGFKKLICDAELYTISFELFWGKGFRWCIRSSIVLVEFSLAVLSTAASFRTTRSRVTIGTAPTFKSVERAQRRKEFYQKLEEKHQALDAERSQCEARTKEEQEEALKQLRKSMVVKANPIPSFYYKGPAPKVEPKKLPLTRPKSPNLSRRKSCSDAVRLPLDERAKTCCRTHRHSLGTHTEPLAPANGVKSKGQVGGQSSNGAGKVKDRAKPTTTKAAPKITKQSNANITVGS